jgi:hypothetical protein
VLFGVKFQRCSFLHITGDDVIRATKGMSNGTMVSKAIVVSEVDATM